MSDATPIRVYGPMLTIERRFRASPERVWAMWTTKEGLERWYWPEPLVATVLHLDVRVGGGYEIAAAGLPHTSRGTYTEVVPHQRLGMIAFVDFIPDTEAYERLDTIEFIPADGGTLMRFTSTRMHSEFWQEMASKGWSSSLDRLARAVDS